MKRLCAAGNSFRKSIEADHPRDTSMNWIGPRPDSARCEPLSQRREEWQSKGRDREAAGGGLAPRRPKPKDVSDQLVRGQRTSLNRQGSHTAPRRHGVAAIAVLALLATGMIRHANGLLVNDSGIVVGKSRLYSQQGSLDKPSRPARNDKLCRSSTRSF
jgi:hypothetical protein